MQNLPDISTARLPGSYEAAKQALSACSRIDECQEWADKAEALASYAKQSRDDSLRKMADRIQARAIRRCGELLKQIEPSKGGRPAETQEGDLPSLSRTQAATDAGLSEHQRKTALRVASVPAENFEAQVESDSPPTVTSLAEQGRKPLVDLSNVDPENFQKATAALGQLRLFAAFAERTDPREAAQGLKPVESARARALVSQVDSWLDRFITSMEN